NWSSDVAGNVARFLGREYQAMQGRGSAHAEAMGATEDAAARRVIAGQGPGERCRLHHLASRGFHNLLDGRAQRLRHRAVPGVAAVGLPRLAPAAAGADARNGLEIRCEHHCAPPAGDLEDLPVDDALRLDRTFPRLRVTVVHDDVRNPARVADAREERYVPLPAALED